jgi:hypothetical protein
MTKLDWDNLPADWTFSYEPEVTERMIGTPLIQLKSSQPVIRGVIQPMTLFCREDLKEIEDWFESGSKLVRCPIFFSTLTVSEWGVQMSYNNITKSIDFSLGTNPSGSPYSFSGAYYTGANADSNFNVINPAATVEWKLAISPVETGFELDIAGENNYAQTSAIPFTVNHRLTPL